MESTVRRPVGIVGAGVMGAGIAEIACAAGFDVLLYDTATGRAAEAPKLIRKNFERRISRGRMSGSEAEQALLRLTPVQTMDDLGAAGLVIEAVAEILAVKRDLMQALEKIVSEDCILATNTSSLSVTEIAAGCSRPERIAGFHFFNPVPAMKVVEVIGGALTAKQTVDALSNVAGQFGHRPVIASDTPGFIVNHAGRGYVTEALEILREGVAPFAVIDRILREGAGFRMGPFELLDLTGLDVSHPVMESIYTQFYHEPRFRPSGIARQRLAAGLLGRKSGRGFYTYADGKRVEAAHDCPPAPSVALPGSVSIVAEQGAEFAERLCRSAGIRLADDGDLVLIPLVGEDASTAAVRHSVDPSRSVGFDAIFGLATHRTLVSTPATSEIARAQALALFRSDGVGADLVEDSVGCICQRVVATIINIASAMIQQRIATTADLDAAVVLGLGYPQGPLAWGDALGPSTVLAILRSIQGITGDPRYRPSVHLKRRAELGLRLAE